MGCRVGSGRRNDGCPDLYRHDAADFLISPQKNLSRKKCENGAEFGKNLEMRDKALQERKLSILFAFGQWIWIDEVLRLHWLYRESAGEYMAMI